MGIFPKNHTPKPYRVPVPIRPNSSLYFSANLWYIKSKQLFSMEARHERWIFKGSSCHAKGQGG